MTGSIPAWALGWCDDAAVFPPAAMPLRPAWVGHGEHLRAPYAALVGPLVLPVSAVPQLAALPYPDGWRELILTFPDGPGTLSDASKIPTGVPVTIAGVEVTAPPGMSPAALDDALARRPDALRRAWIAVEIPRDRRRASILALCARNGYRAKFRTGGVTAPAHPDEAELAGGIAAAVAAGVRFKATAGLHHAVRNTDPATGFEQHGFLNLLLATDAALTGAATADLASILALRAHSGVRERLERIGPVRAATARTRFLSFGTCSIADPLADLIELGLVLASAGENTGSLA